MKTKKEIKNIQKNIEKKLFSSYLIIFLIFSVIPILMSSYLLVHDIVTTVNFVPKEVRKDEQYIQFGDNGQGKLNILIINKLVVEQVPKEKFMMGTAEDSMMDLSWTMNKERFNKRFSFEWHQKELYLFSVVDSDFLYVYRLTDQLYFLIINILIVIILILPIIMFIKKMSKRISRKITTPLEETYENQIQLLESINHDVKTPVTAIKLSGNRLEKSILEDNQKKSFKWLNYINVNNIKLEQMVWKLEAVYFGEEIEKGTIDVLNLLRENCELLTPLAKIEQKLFLMKSYESLQVTGSEELLNDIVYNLLKNAVEHSKEESDIIVSHAKEKNKIKIEITNKMKYEEISTINIEKLTEKFYQNSKNEKSSGVGLFLVKNLVEKLNGNISFEISDSNLFTVTLILEEEFID